MKTQLLFAAAFGALALSAVASAASAEPDFYYRANPPSSNPHDVFRTATKVYRTPEAAALARQAACDCAMMKGDKAMQDQCMAVMSAPNAAAAKPAAAG